MLPIAVARSMTLPQFSARYTSRRSTRSRYRSGTACIAGTACIGTAARRRFKNVLDRNILKRISRASSCASRRRDRSPVKIISPQPRAEVVQHQFPASGIEASADDDFPLQRAGPADRRRWICMRRDADLGAPEFRPLPPQDKILFILIDRDAAIDHHLPCALGKKRVQVICPYRVGEHLAEHMLVLGEGEIPQCSLEGFPAAERRFICRCIPPHPPAYLRNRPDAEVIAVHKIPALRMEREDVACVLVRVPLAGPA